MSHFFHTAPFLCCTFLCSNLFMLHSFSCCTLFTYCTFPVGLLHVAMFSLSILLLLPSSHVVEIFCCCTLFMLHFFWRCSQDSHKHQRWKALQHKLTKLLNIEVLSEVVAKKRFVKKGVFRNFAKFTGKHLPQGLF